MQFDATLSRLGPTGEDLSFAVRRRTSSWLRTVLRASAVVLAGSGILAVASQSPPIWWIYGSFALVVLAALVLDTLKQTRAAGIVLPLGFWLVSTATVFLLGGVRSPGTFVYLPIVITAGLFWSLRAAAGLAIASLAIELLVAWMEASGLLPVPLQAPTSGPLFRIFAGSLIMTAVLVGVALLSLRAALADVRRYALRTEELLLEGPGVIAVFDRLGVVLAVGPASGEGTGYHPAELVGRHVSRVELFDEDRRLVGDEFRKLARGGDLPREFRLRRKNGTRSWGEARAHQIASGNGDALVRIVLYDVTRRKAAEERQAELEKRVEQSRRLEAMGLLVGGVTHDFNNLLTVILSVGSALDAHLPPDSGLRELVRDMNDSALRAAALARQLLAVRPSDDAQPIDLGQHIEGLRPVFSRLVGDGVRLVVRVDARTSLVRVDPVHLEQIAVNLVVNARDAMPNGGELTILTRRDPATRFAEFCVMDSGVGMDSATKQHIFEPFYTTKGNGGTGLGLAAVDGIVTRLGGRIQVDSEPGRGTCVKVLLPETDPSHPTASNGLQDCR